MKTTDINTVSEISTLKKNIYSALARLDDLQQEAGEKGAEDAISEFSSAYNEMETLLLSVDQCIRMRHRFVNIRSLSKNLVGNSVLKEATQTNAIEQCEKAINSLYDESYSRLRERYRGTMKHVEKLAVTDLN